jgi:glycine cleavage system transcriptional repressor
MKKNLALLTVVGPDRSGIIAKVTGVLFEKGCNLEDVSMTILEQQFAMIMVVCLGSNRKEKIQQELDKVLRDWKLTSFWKDLDANKAKPKHADLAKVTYLITAIGRDRTGIVYEVSQILARYKLNINDLNSKILGQGSKALYAMALETDIPKKFSLKKIQNSLEKLRKKLGVELQLKRVERIEF